MINLNTSFPANSGSPTTDYPYGSARNVTTTGDNTGTPFVASLQNDIIGNQQYLLQEAGVTPNNTPDNATTSQQFEALWKITNLRTFTKNMTVNTDYTLTARENLKTRIRITDTTPVLTTGRNIIVDTVSRLIIAQNATLQTLTFKTPSGTGIAVLAGTTKMLYCDGTNVIQDSYYIQSASETESGIIELATTAEAQAATDDLRAITPLKLFNSLKGSNQNLSASGYQKLHGGLIIQWGTATASSAAAGTNTTVTLPVTFPTSCTAAIATNTGAAASNSTYNTTEKTTSTFTVQRGNNANAEMGTSFNWFAIGY